MTPPFVLVHGAWHSPACWSPLIDELTTRGERAVAADLPCDDPEATLDDYVQAVVDAAAAFDEPVTVVGHSLAGITIPLVPARRPVAGLVFVAAALPRPGEAGAVALADGALTEGFALLSAEHVTTADDGGSQWDAEGAVAIFYHDVPDAVAAEATRALRAQHWGPVQEVWPLDAYPDVPVRYVACEDDRIISGTWQVETARERLGVEADVLPGSHSPMLARPAALADLLLRGGG